ncbi:MAG: ComF family protein [Verrucomicrobia bacterium]|nr:ComF family protein [Verrucomicrobiota bacterium]
MTTRTFANALFGFGRTALDLLYPRQCQMCGGTLRCVAFSFLCDDCFADAPRLEPPYCSICAMPFHGIIGPDFRCPNCGQIRLHFDRAMAVMRFQGVVRRAIHSLKYGHQGYWARVLQSWLLEGVDPLLNRSEADVVLPVPLHPVRERERGFNQAWFLADALARSWKIPAHRRVLTRVRQTETQTHLDREERMANLRGAFAVRRPAVVAGRRVLLMDDVLTTGSTASECARILREAGARSVLVLTLARG